MLRQKRGTVLRCLLAMLIPQYQTNLLHNSMHDVIRSDVIHIRNKDAQILRNGVRRIIVLGYSVVPMFPSTFFINLKQKMQKLTTTRKKMCYVTFKTTYRKHKLIEFKHRQPLIPEKKPILVLVSFQILFLKLMFLNVHESFLR